MREPGGIVDRSPQFARDRLLLPFDGGEREDRIEQDVAQQVDGEGVVVVEDDRVVAGVVAAGKAADAAAGTVHGTGDLERVTAAGALERQVLAEVGDSLLVRLLRRGTDLDEDAESDRASRRDRLRHHPDAVLENRFLTMAHPASHVRSRSLRFLWLDPTGRGGFLPGTPMFIGAEY